MIISLRVAFHIIYIRTSTTLKYFKYTCIVIIHMDINYFCFTYIKLTTFLVQYAIILLIPIIYQNIILLIIIIYIVLILNRLLHYSSKVLHYIWV